MGRRRVNDLEAKGGRRKVMMSSPTREASKEINRHTRRAFNECLGLGIATICSVSIPGCQAPRTEAPVEGSSPFRNITVFRDKYRYVLGPSIAVTQKGEWVVAFSLGVMREVTDRLPDEWKHPPSDPSFQNVLTRSGDLGKTWDVPRVYPGFNWTSAECPGLAVLSDGTLLASVYVRQFYPKETADKMPDLPGAVPRDPYPWVSTHRGTFVHRSSDGGRTWDETVEVDTGPFISGYSPKGAVELEDGTVVLPLAAGDPFYDEYFESRGIPDLEALGNERDEGGEIKPGKSVAFVAVSKDRGQSWSETREIARDPGVNFFEPCLARLKSGRLISHMRTSEKSGGRYLYQVVSDDNGHTWSQPKRLPIWGFPAHIVQLPDERVVTVYGHRREPFGIRACVSSDQGETWDIENEVILRDDLGSSNLGYPTSIVQEDGGLFTVYWGEDSDGVTTIQGTYWRV
ncbi:MAG: exo-alpha-sialidase [Acidobacteriia bacterium]|nr:exo-alpha-sialidase [Terriglobia bacterium]